MRFKLKIECPECGERMELNSQGDLVCDNPDHVQGSSMLGGRVIKFPKGERPQTVTRRFGDPDLVYEITELKGAKKK